MTPIQVDVVAPIPEGWGLCTTCEAFLAQAGVDQAPYERGLESFPPEWREDFMRFSDLVQAISGRFGSRVLFRLYDPRSLQGLAKSIRYGVRHYPTFVIQGKERITGLEFEPLEKAIRARLGEEVAG